MKDSDRFAVFIGSLVGPTLQVSIAVTHAMPRTLPLRLRASGPLAIGIVLLAGCSSLPMPSLPSLPAIGSLGLYRVDVVQGNFISQETAAQVRPGLTRAEVRDLLGTPLVASALHTNRWDYAFTLIRGGSLTQQYRFSVFFNGDRVARTDGTELPPEKEFVAAIAPRASASRLPDVSEEVQKQFAEAAARAAAQAPAAPVPPATFPPLESPGARAPSWDTPVPRAPARPAATPAAPR